MDKEKSSTEAISVEIKELISSIDKFMLKRDELVDSFRKICLSGSNNN